MKAKLILACVAAGIAAATVGTTASADNAPTGSIGFIPGSGRPGETIKIIGSCNDPAFTITPVISDVLTAAEISGTDADGTGRPYLHLRAFATVKANAQLGEHKVSFKCGTRLVTGHFRVGTPRPAALSVSPRKGVPGTKVTVRVVCEYLSSVTSGALTDRYDNTMIVKNVKPGIYKVSLKCDDRDLSTTFTVLDPKSSAKNAQVPLKPKGSAETGDLADA